MSLANIDDIYNTLLVLALILPIAIYFCFPSLPLGLVQPGQGILLASTYIYLGLLTWQLRRNGSRTTYDCKAIDTRVKEFLN